MRRAARFLFKLTPFRISLLITVAVLFAMQPRIRERLQLLELFEYKIYDFRMQLRGVQPPGDEVVIVAIDDATLDELGRWPVSRRDMADVVRVLREDGAKVVAWDVVFSEPDKNSELVRMRELRRLLDQLGLDGRGLDLPERLERLRQRLRELRRRIPARRRALVERALTAVEQRLEELRRRQRRFYRYVVAAERRADTDRYFASTISEAGNVVLGYFFRHTTDPETAVRAQAAAELIRPSQITIIRTPAGFEGPWPGEGIYNDIEANIPLLSRATDHFGYFTIQPDMDGTIRRYPLVVRFAGGYYPSLALKSIQLLLDTPLIIDVEAPEGGLPALGVSVGNLRVPVDEIGQLLINYRGPGGVFPRVSFADVLRRRFPPGTFKDRIALIGPTAIGIMDLRVTPFDQISPGVEIHANVIDNIFRQTFYAKPAWMWAFDIAAVIVIGFLLGVILSPLRSVYSAIVVVVLAVAYLFGGQYLLVEQGIWITTVYPLLELFGVFVAVTIYKYYTEERKRKEIRSAFQYYLSPAVIEQVLADPDRLKLGGEKRELTVLFSDIRGFTTISESLDAEELSNLLNEYLTPMTNIVFDTGGTLDKYMGDAIMAFWGAPIDQPDHPQRACVAALTMMERLGELARTWEERGYPRIDIGIGINTGVMSVGNMGSNQRFDYTVMGDAVNLGSRLEGLNKQYGTHVLMGQHTYAHVKDDFFCREIDFVAVKGKREPVRIYELIAREPIPELVPLVEAFEEGLRLYRAGEFARAYEHFKRILERYPDDGPSRTFLERSRELVQNPPEGEWNGVFVAKTK